MTVINFDEFKRTPEYQDFQLANPDIGTLKVQAFTAYNALPVEGTDIMISKDIEEYRVVFFRGQTDSSGIIDNIQLPAPQSSIGSIEPPLYTVYDLTAIHTGFESIKQYSIGMFGGIKVIQYVKMIPEIILEGVEQNGN